MDYMKVLDWIDKEMKFDVWYNVKSDEQIEIIKDLIRAGFLPDCVFNEDYSKFKKIKEYYDFHFRNANEN